MFLQRASAGSGKTFKLAKIYIRNLISHKFTHPKDGRVDYILRTDAELTDAHSHILAITFTNKATNEMKERIVAKLADLAAGPREDASGKVRMPDYLDDFQRELVTTDLRIPSVDDIRHTAQAALKVLLNTYSDFQISTIDAFFQSILRTLTFELDLSDNYHVELNDDFIARMGVDQTLSMINHRNRPGSPEVYEWLSKIITSRLDEGRPWDIFAKNSMSSSSMYNELLHFTKKISNESFKKIKDSIRGYFKADNRAFVRFYDAMIDASEHELRQCRRECLRAIAALEAEFQANFPAGDINEIFSSGLGSFIKIVKRADITFNVGKGWGATFAKFIPALNPGDMPDPVKAKHRGKKTFPALTEKMADVGQSVWQWYQRAGYWHSMTSRLHYLGLLDAVMNNIEAFRTENDIIQLSDTNSIIHKIIGEDDAPFIYERTGNIITNYLIDEFQDTSTLQWENLNPLLAESESHGYDNLIIGDAKQSIYRFRNAEPELITSQVEKDFPQTEIWNSAADNTNWRSARQIVEFNNFLFARLAQRTDHDTIAAEKESARSEQELRNALSKRKSVGALYANTVQKLHNAELDGYISINFSKDSELDALPDLLQEILRRGYAQKDIAVLADTNGDCRKIITTLMASNADNVANPEYEQIEIISEESLKVSESEAVKLILSVLALISSSGSQLRPDDVSMERFVCLCNYLTSSRPDADVSKVLSEGLDLDPNDEIMQFVESASSYTLPALIELIVGKFLPKEMRDSHSAYISALLDLALDYCENNATDIRSFIKWWDDNGDKATISSPEGINAVQVMTIHKSKGLEFDCVIIPSAEWELAPTKENEEILWVKSDGIIPQSAIPINPEDVPDYIPVVPSQFLKEPQTGLREVYLEYCDKCRIDQINKAYVAFTRPVRELHIFAPAGDLKKPSEKIGRYLYDILKEPGELGAIYDPSAMTFSLGTLTRKETAKQSAASDSAEDIRGYYVNTSLPAIGYITDDDEANAPDEETETSEEARRTGLLIHSILSTVRTAADIPRAVTRRVVNGTISATQASELTRRLEDAASHPEAKQWFSAENKVFSERDICIGIKTRRPDRIILTPDNDIIIVDYKTGDPANADNYKGIMKEYGRIVTRYFASLGVEAKSVRAFLFFISPDTALRPDIVIPLSEIDSKSVSNK